MRSDGRTLLSHMNTGHNIQKLNWIFLKVADTIMIPSIFFGVFWLRCSILNVVLSSGRI